MTGSSGSGGSNAGEASGGSVGSGGAVASGGVTAASGGNLGSGGMTTGSGGAATSSGGAPGSGGVTGSGGAAPAGGRSGAQGGATAVGGRPGSGGATASGGSPASGGRGVIGAGGRGGAAATTGSGGAAGMSACPMVGHVTYKLTKSSSPSADEDAAYTRITTAMDMAVTYYNCYTAITKADTVTYVPSVQTADGNTNGSIRFGSTDSMNYITAMHEISHTVGIGSAQFDALVVNGIFTGTAATDQLRAITGNPQDQVHGDTQHFWPNGLNYTTEVTSVPGDLINHCLMVTAIRKDMGM